MAKTTTNKTQNGNKLVADLADYLFANPEEKRSTMLKVFGKKWQCSQRTFDRILKQAKEYNATRLNAQQKAVNAEVQQAMEHIHECIISRERILRRLVDIAYNGQSDSSSVRAIDLIAKIEGWYAPVKTANTDSKGNDIEYKPLTPEEIKKKVEELDRFC